MRSAYRMMSLFHTQQLRYPQGGKYKKPTCVVGPVHEIFVSGMREISQVLSTAVPGTWF